MSNGSPPITPAPSPPSAPGIAQPVIVEGGQSLPPSFPLGTAGTWLPPPQVGMGENEPFATPVVPPGVVTPWPTQQPPLPTQPQFPTGSATAPTAAELFPEFTAAGPSPPIIVSAVQPPPPVPLPLPTTPGILAIVLNGWGLGAGPGGEGNAAIFPTLAALGHDEPPSEPPAAPLSAEVAPKPKAKSHHKRKAKR